MPLMHKFRCGWGRAWFDALNQIQNKKIDQFKKLLRILTFSDFV